LYLVSGGFFCPGNPGFPLNPGRLFQELKFWNSRYFFKDFPLSIKAKCPVRPIYNIVGQLSWPPLPFFLRRRIILLREVQNFDFETPSSACSKPV
jgi:hypothetical protein